MQLEEFKNKEETEEEGEFADFLSDCEDEEEETNYLNREFNIKKKYNVYFNFELNRNKKYSMKVKTDYFDVDEFHAYDLIKYVVKKLNNSNIKIKNNNKNYSFSLKDVEDEENIDFYINNYEIKPFDSLTKNDFRNFSPTDPLKSINEENISFFSKNPLNILLIKLL